MTPLLFKNKISRWPANQWTMDSLETILKDQLLQFRFGKRNDTKVQLENECQRQNASMKDFLSWLAGHSPSTFDPFPQETFWAYSDYNHIVEKFADNTQLHKAVDWSVFGLPGRCGKESTLWVGSAGSFTICHQDTYGCNLVAQIHGRKRWILFPPGDAECLYPSRMPFEESSVFSTVNILRPDLSKHPRFSEVRAYVVTLEPGDVLFVPRHWWHHVQSLEPSISINTWVDMPEMDNEERSREAVTKCVMHAMMAHRPTSTWLNHTQKISTAKENMVELNGALHVLAENARKAISTQSPSMKRKHNWGADGDRTEAKKRKSNSGAGVGGAGVGGGGAGCGGVQEKICSIPDGQKLEQYSFLQLQEILHPEDTEQHPGTSSTGLSREMDVMNVSGLSDSTEDLVSRDSQEKRPRRELTCEDMAECLADREVVELIRKKIQKKYGEKNKDS